MRIGADSAVRISRPVEAWLRWLYDELGFIPGYIVIDMSATEKKAIIKAYRGLHRQPVIHWCTFHVWQAWEEAIKGKVKPLRNHHNPYENRETVKKQLRVLQDTTEEADFEILAQEIIADWRDKGLDTWTRYWTGTYYENRALWAGPWRTVSRLISRQSQS